MKLKPNHFHTSIAVSEIERSNGMKYSVRQTRERYFFPDEWQVFYDKLKPKQKITFHSLINIGCRINELRHVRVDDIIPDRNYILIRRTKVRNKDGTPKKRTLPVSSQYIKYILKIIKDFKLSHEDYLPILSTPAANIAMKKALRKAGIPDFKMFSVHNVRKSLETWLIALDVDSLKVCDHFGHSIKIAQKHYVSPDTFSYADKEIIRQIIGDLYQKRH